MCLCWLIAVWSLLLPLPANFPLPGFLQAEAARVWGGSSSNCAVFVANRIIIGAGADSWVVIGPVEERWRLASRQARLQSSTATQKRKNTHFKNPSATEGGQLLSSPFFLFFFLHFFYLPCAALARSEISHHSICFSVCLLSPPTRSLTITLFWLFIFFSSLQLFLPFLKFHATTSCCFFGWKHGWYSWNCQVEMIKFRLEMGWGNSVPIQKLCNYSH